ncbi:hypothetical protein EZI54_23270 [Marinobacter halodurans]|uniref:DUF91 domain-containing protein n=1 Tax=Marinobacter halodurans TaxID=2528979 RepID=A0ABY1ZDW5_9GAMM|nr:hypothetical protein [Marinobacter halodurans]TBW46399.1 hypothetical protein EZI54_23270 [Marinobacter halodurans]
MIFSVSESLEEAKKILPSSFTSLNIWERKHIEEWVRSNPELLGEDLLIVSIEFDRFTNSNDRLDVLALDRSGNLVVIELKRDSAAGYADLQALRYAAMVSSMTIEVLLPYYIAYRKKYDGEVLSDGEAKDQIIEFVESDSFVELSNKPRIIICSEGFSQEITATVLWLRESDVDISCVKITPYQIGSQVVIVPKVVIPLEEARQYLIDIKRKEEVKELSVRKNRPKTMKILIENNLVHEGDNIYLKYGLPTHVEFDPNDPMFRATITGKLGQSDAIQWEKDGQEYSISALTWMIFKELHPDKKDPGGVNGNWHWVHSNGNTLWQIAEQYLESHT